ncbi:hypothetical protein Dimus_013623, partial [Dionaea muscipula]
MITDLQCQLKDNERKMQLVMDLKDDLHEADLRLNEADVVIESLQYEMNSREEEWWARVDSLWWQIEEFEKGRSTMGLSPPSYYSRETHLVVENATTALVRFVTLPTSKNVATPTSPILKNDGGDVESVVQRDAHPSQAMGQNDVIEDSIESEDSDLLGDFDWDDIHNICM